MKLTTMTQLTVDGVMQGNGPMDVDRGNGFERGGWAMGAGDNETRALIAQTYQRAGAFLFGRRTDSGSDIALDLVDSRADSKGVTIQVYRPAGRPHYATAGAEVSRIAHELREATRGRGVPNRRR